MSSATAENLTIAERAPANEEGSLANTAPAPYIRIRVVAQDGNEIIFRLKRELPLKKLMDKFCQSLGVPTTSTRFLFDGHRINPDDSPNTLEMEDEDIIEVYQEQTGGGPGKKTGCGRGNFA